MLPIIKNLENNLVVRKGRYLVYLSEMLKAYLKVPSLLLVKVVMNTVRLVHLNQTLMESRRGLHLY